MSKKYVVMQEKEFNRHKQSNFVLFLEANPDFVPEKDVAVCIPLWLIQFIEKEGIEELRNLIKKYYENTRNNNGSAV